MYSSIRDTRSQTSQSPKRLPTASRQACLALGREALITRKVDGGRVVFFWVGMRFARAVVVFSNILFALGQLELNSMQLKVQRNLIFDCPAYLLGRDINVSAPRAAPKACRVVGCRLHGDFQRVEGKQSNWVSAERGCGFEIV